MFVCSCVRFGIVSSILYIFSEAVPIPMGPRLPDAFDFGLSPEDNLYDEIEDNPHGNDGASKYINLGLGPRMASVDGPPARIQAELKEAMEAAEAKRLGVAEPERPHIEGPLLKPQDDEGQGAIIKMQNQKNDVDIPDSDKAQLLTSNEKQNQKNDAVNPDTDKVGLHTSNEKQKPKKKAEILDPVKAGLRTINEKQNQKNDAEIPDTKNQNQKNIAEIAETNKAGRTLGRMLSSTDYESAQSDYDINAEAAEIWDQIEQIARKFQERSKRMKESLSNVKDRKAAAIELRKEVVGQIAELSVSLAETYPNGNKDSLLEKLGAAKNTIQQSIDSILLGHNVHYDQDNL